MDIIGAGIGGLVTAISFKQSDIDFRIYEQAKVIKPVGAGIVLANNAMQVLKKLGLKDEIEDNGNAIASIRITDTQLRKLSEMNLRYFEQKYGVQNVAIHRGILQQILIKHLPVENIFLDHNLESIDVGGDKLSLNFENRPSVNSDYLIGADGLNSVVRNTLLDNGIIRSAKQICWRGFLTFTLPKNYQSQLNEAWGKGERFGFVQIGPNKVYWYALKSFRKTPDEFSIEELTAYYNDYHPIIKELINGTPADSIHTSIISDLKPMKRWFKHNICLIGDAAHATTPNMGQGACQGIEDAYVMSECLKKFGLRNAFEAYQRLRMPKAHQVVKTSWKLGKMAHWKNPLAIAIRNKVLKMTPQQLNRKQSEQIFELNEI